MDARVRAQLARASASIREDKSSVEAKTDKDTSEVILSQEDLDSWLDAFCSRYAETLEYLQSH